MSVAVKKIPGVESVKVSLNEGRAVIVLKPGNSVRLEQIRTVINEQGFTPKDAKIIAIGDLTEPGGHLELKVSGNNDVFPVLETPHAGWQKQVGSNLLVSGMIATPPTAKEPGTIQITEVTIAK